MSAEQNNSSQLPGMPPPPPAAAVPDEENDKTTVHRGLDNLEGEIISDRYQIIKRIGKGGMGVVYLAQQTKLNRNVCLKVLNPALLDDEDAVGRFEREAKGLSRLQHPNIVTIFDYGRDGDLAYIVMEYAQGETLSKYLKARGALHVDDFLPIAVQTLKGIGEAHKLGLIHRDIKPANIILSELEGEKNFVKILDFGLAKLAQGQEDVTKDQQLVGSASYMAPEQILQGQSDTRTDVYALGVMFYLMLAGKKPFVGANDNVVLYKHVNELPKPLQSYVTENQNVPEPLCEVIMQCLSKEPEKRPQTAIDLLNAISYALDAPQLRAGYSSMSVSHLELKSIEESELRASSQMAAAVSRSGDGFVSVPASSIPGMVAISNPGIQTNLRTERSARDRRILIILLCLIGVAVAIIAAVIIGSTTRSGKDPVPVVQHANGISGDSQNDMSAVFSEIENNISKGQWQVAEELINSLEKVPEAQDAANILKISQLKTKVDIGRLMAQANSELEKNNFDEAAKLFEKVLASDASHEGAKQALAQINSMPVVLFQLKPESIRAKAQLLVDGEPQGAVPQNLRLKPGNYMLSITCDGYKDWERMVTLENSDNMDLPVELERASRSSASDTPSISHGSGGKGQSKSGLLIGGKKKKKL